MEWEEAANNPLILKNYDIFRESGILKYIEELLEEKKATDFLLLEAYEIFRQESVEEIFDLIVKYFSDKFIPSKLTFILNEEIMFNRIKIIAYENMQSIETDVEIESLEGMEHFFRINSKTISFVVLENEFNQSESVKGFRKFNPEIVVPVLGISGLMALFFSDPKYWELSTLKRKFTISTASCVLLP